MVEAVSDKMSILSRNLKYGRSCCCVLIARYFRYGFRMSLTRKSRWSEKGCSEERGLKLLQVSVVFIRQERFALVKAVSAQVSIHSRDEKYEMSFC